MTCIEPKCPDKARPEFSMCDRHLRALYVRLGWLTW